MIRRTSLVALAALSTSLCFGETAASDTRLATTASPSAPAAAAPATPPAASSSPKITYTACHVDGPYIAITFDDGPHPQNTPRLLDMLKQRGIKATFFMVGQNANAYPEIVKRILAEGHEIGNHSWSHPVFSKMNDASVRSEIERTQQAIANGCGLTPTLMRPPYGAFTERQRRWANGEFGFKIILWDVDPLDWKIRNAAHVQSEILKQTHAGSIILSHDIHKTTIDAMPATLDQLLAKGYKFVTVSQLIAMDKPSAKSKAEPKTYAPAETKSATQSEPPAATPSAAAAAAAAVSPATPKAPTTAAAAAAAVTPALSKEQSAANDAPASAAKPPAPAR